MSSAGKALFRKDALGILGTQILLLVFIVLVWEILTRFQILDTFYYGQPTQVWDHLINKLQDGSLLVASRITLLETLAGFALGMSLGTVLGLALWWSPTVTKIVEPFLVALNAIPKLTFAPIFLLLVGLGFAFKVAVAFAATVIVAVLSAYSGTRETDPDLIDLVRSVGASRWQIFTIVVVPTALPWLIISMKITVGFALIGAVVGEFIAANDGLGYMAVLGSGAFDMSLVMVSVFALMILAALMYGAVQILEAWLLAWRPSDVESIMG